MSLFTRCAPSDSEGTTVGHAGPVGEYTKCGINVHVHMYMH